MDMNQTVKNIHDTACEKGWWENPRTALEIHALIHSEVSEATEAVRNGEEDSWISKVGKPEGEAVELMDAVIRIMDYFGHRGWDFEDILNTKMAYNNSRPYRHGNKKA